MKFYINLQPILLNKIENNYRTQNCKNCKDIYIYYIRTSSNKKEKKYKNIKHNINIENTNKIINNFKIVKIYLHHLFAKNIKY